MAHSRRAALGAVALDIPPGLGEQGHLSVSIAGFTLGGVILLGLRQLESHGAAGPADRQATGLTIGLLVAVGVDLLVDRILAGLSVATLGPPAAIALTIALTLVVLPLALSVTVEVSRRGVGRMWTAVIPPLLSLTLVVGAIGASLVLGSAPAALLAGILPFGVAVCIGCGACVAACPNGSAMLFAGAKVTHLGTLPQSQPERGSRALAIVAQHDDEGFGACTQIGECAAVCPRTSSST